MKEESVCICVVSKSGITMETRVTYAILKEQMELRYGIDGCKERIFVITGEQVNPLKQEAVQEQFEIFEIPDDVSGRYSVLTAAGLLPIAVAGHDIYALLEGAKEMDQSSVWEDSLLDYAVARVALQRQGKGIEIFECFESNLQAFGEWVNQLFGESEGKDGKGAYPAVLCFSKDLHSLGQFLQQGNQIFYEIMIRIKQSGYDYNIPKQAGEPYCGKNLEMINHCIEQGVIRAHEAAGIPFITIEIPQLNEYYLGQMIYFFEMSCAVSAYLLGVNPFDQPGVENYKRELFHLLESVEKQQETLK